ncbi:MAG: Orotate phosphoribosyltransferase [Luteibacter sp.]|uniref:ComF family protein n=1 Tax=Luteibacter sp. TaxID=1886636 RepID=UPI001381966A|nr:ComF family protein [Luteibacter sp.]KAF1005660.1 MAG: Orotate phosphoribosyltransferase [Luteibacter sp.]
MDASFLKRVMAVAGRFVLPPRCMACGDEGHDGVELCEGCLAALPRNEVRCQRCALPLVRDVAMCGACQKHLRPWDAIWVPYRYDTPIDRLESRFKFGGSLAAGRTLSMCWVRSGAPPALPEALVPVPLHRARLRSRGFNQSLELVRPVARRYGIPVLRDALRRHRATEAQSELDAVSRARNVHGAFVATKPLRVDHVAVVDDVMTTGATLAACVDALRDAGAKRVDVWALARTGLS